MSGLSEEEIKKLEEMENGLYDDNDIVIDDGAFDKSDIEDNDNTPDTGGETRVYKSTFLDSYDNLESSGYIQINPELIPSMCRFYPDDYKFYIKKAKVKDVRLFTDIANDEFYNVNEKIEVILKSCVKIISQSGQVSYREILDIDKIFFIIAIRDLTFYDIPKPMVTKHICHHCNHINRLEIYSNNTEFFSEKDSLKFVYDMENKNYTLDIDDTGRVIHVRPPSIQVSNLINDYIKDKNKRGLNYNKETLNIIKYLDLDWSTMTYKDVDSIMQITYGWDIYQESKVSLFIQDFKNSIFAKVYGECNNCGTEVAPPFSVEGGFRNIFIIQN